MTAEIIKFKKPTTALAPRQLLDDLEPIVPDLVSLVVIGFTKDGEEVSGWCSEDMAMTALHVDTVKQRIINSFMEEQ